jgi:FixJ family two-component response regulator
MIRAAGRYAGLVDPPPPGAPSPVVRLHAAGAVEKHPLVAVVDDDESVRESLPDLLKQLGFASRAFSSGEAFLASGCIDETSCLILDVAMPGMSGPELKAELEGLGQDVPIIFITGRRDEALRARLLRGGAAAFLLKPFSDAALLAAVESTC